MTEVLVVVIVLFGAAAALGLIARWDRWNEARDAAWERGER